MVQGKNILMICIPFFVSLLIFKRIYGIILLSFGKEVLILLTYIDDMGYEACVEPVPLLEFVSQSEGEMLEWFREYCKYGGLKEIHDISPYYELPEGTKIAEYALKEKEKLLKRITEAVIEYFVGTNNLHDKADVKRFVKHLTKNTGIVESPHKLELEMADYDLEAPDRIRDNTLKKYLELLSVNGIIHRVPVYDPKRKNTKINMSAYYFSDIGIARVLNGGKLNLKALYSSIICNELSDADMFTGRYITTERVDSLRTRRVHKAVDLLIPDQIAIQVIPVFHKSELAEACHAMKLLGDDYRKYIVTQPDEQIKNQIKAYCPDGMKVLDIIEFIRDMK